MIFACDVNLGFPTDDPEWAAFFRDHGWRTVNYDDMGKLTATLKAHQPAAAFMPAANYYYLKDDPFYAGLASACAERSGGTIVTSVLIVPPTSDARNVLDLRGKRLGHINSCCATGEEAYSMAILLAEHDVPFGTFFSTVEPVGAWQHQIDAVVAGRVDATMVEKGIWLDKPANAAATKIIRQRRPAARAGDRVGHVGRPGFRVRVPDQAAGVPDRGAGPAVPRLHRLLHRCGAGVL